MKYIFTSMLLLMIAMSKAQIVNIPDSNFKKKLVNYYPVIDINHDGEIQQSEADAVSELHLYFFRNDINVITDISGIKAFKNIKKLVLEGLRQSMMDISGLDNLKVLMITEDSLLSLNSSGCLALDSIWLNYNSLLNSVDISSSPNVRFINLDKNNQLNSFRMGAKDSLRTFFQDYTPGINSNHDTIDLTSYKNLELVYLWNTTYKTVNLSSLTKLRFLSLTPESFIPTIEEINLNGCKALTTVQFDGRTVLKKLLLDGCISLTSLNIPQCQISSLDISTCYNLTDVSFYSPVLKNLNLKNGILNRLDLSLTISDTSQINICTDEFETDLIRSPWWHNNNVNITPYCSFFPGGIYNIIKGKSRIGNNVNGCDSTDRGVGNIALKISDTSGNSLTRYTSPSGDYAYYPYKGIFTVTPYFPYPYFTIAPGSTIVHFDTANSLTSVANFCISANGTYNDLEITFLPTTPARLTFESTYALVYKNRGTTTLNGNVQLSFNSSKMNFATASENVASQSTGQLTWNYSNLQPFESRTIYVTFNLLPPPVNNIGDTITYLAAITPATNDETAFDNSFILPQRVIGSFDPNDKQCLEGSKLDISKLGD